MHSTYSRSKVPNRNIPATPDYKPPESELEGGVYSRAFDIWSFGCVLLEMVCWTLGGEHNRVGFETARQKPWILGVNRCIFFDVMLKTPETSILPKPSRKGLGAVLSPSSMCSVLPRVYSRMTFMRHAPGTPHSEPSIPSEPSHYEHAIMVKAKVNQVRHTLHWNSVNTHMHQWIVRLHADPMCTQFIHELLDLIENKMIIVITPGHERIRSGDLLVKLSEMCDKVSDPESSYGSKPCPKKQPLKECLPVDALLISRTKDLVKDNSLQVDTYQGKTQTSKTPDEFRAME
jgi:serine/threonine protein kinase